MQLSRTHLGAHHDVDRADGSLAVCVADHAPGVEASIRDYCIVGNDKTADDTLWQTEVSWPILRTGPDPSSTD